MVQHDSRAKKFTMNIMNEKFDSWELESEYDGRLNDYTETPYNFGCGNYFQQVDDSHYFWADYTLHNVGLIENCKYSIDNILKFMTDNANSTFQSVNPLDDIIGFGQDQASDRSSTQERIEFYSNGFKIASSGTNINNDGTKYIFMAWAHTTIGGPAGTPPTAV